jgi:hypothetical protein
MISGKVRRLKFYFNFLDRINRIFRIFYFHHFPEESDETQSRLAAGKIASCKQALR